MKLAPPRAKLIMGWPVPAGPKEALSRLSSLSYFNLCLLGIKNVTICLNIFAKLDEKKFQNKLRPCLIREWLAVRFLIMCNVSFAVIDVGETLIISSDASFACMANAAFQYTRQPTMHAAAGVVPMPCSDLKGKPIDRKLVVVGCYSRTFSAGWLGRATVLKEVRWRGELA